MGIHRLTSFYRNNCNMDRVSIQDLLKEYRKENLEIENPEVVVDGTAFLRKLYNDLDWVCGGQMRMYKAKVEEWMDKFNVLGIKMVFFFDGPTVEQKRKEWVKRRCNKMTDVKKIIDHLWKCTTKYHLSSANHLFTLPPALGTVARFFYNLEFGCEVHISVRENDEELAEYARRNNCFAILAEDSDFLIHKNAKYYLSLQNFRIDDMSTIIYNRKSLANVLKIRAKELPFLATIKGNDYVSTDMLLGFKYRNFKDIAHYINKLNINFDEDLDKVYKKISVDVFGTENKYSLIKASVEASSGVFDPDKTIIDKLVADCPSSTEDWRRILEEGLKRHRNGKMSAHVWAVLAGIPYELSTAIEDFSRNDLPAAATLFKPLRQRIYGLLLKEKPLTEHQSSHEVLEWCVDGNFTTESRAVPVKANTEFFTSTVPHPGLLKLWSSDANNSVDAVDEKWNLFVKIVAPNLNIEKLKKIEPYLVFPTLAINYLMENVECINVHDASAFAALAVNVKKLPLSEMKCQSVRKMSERAVMLATLYMRAYGFLTMLLTILDGPIPLKETMPWYSFDGLLYQEIYEKAVDIPKAYDYKKAERYQKNGFLLCNTDKMACKDYERVMDLVCENS